MSVTSFQTCGTVIQISDTEAVWSGVTVENLATSDDAYTSVAMAAGDLTSQILRCTNFGFSLPATSTIDGVELRLERKGTQTLTGVTESVVQVVVGGSPEGDDQGTNDTWPTSDASITFGGPSNLWGTTLTQAEVEATGFGWQFRAFNQSWFTQGETASIDIAEMRIFFTAPDPPASVIGGAAGGGIFASKGKSGGFIA